MRIPCHHFVVSKSRDDRGLFFLHIRKCAGTTLRAILRRQFPPASVFAPNHATTVNVNEAQRRSVRLLMGHFPFGSQRELAVPFDVLTMLRDPVDRVVSLYFYARGRASPMGRSVGDMSLEDFARHHPLASNDQVRMIAGDVDRPPDQGMLLRAKENLRDHIAAFGLHERFDESVLLFRRRFGWDMPYYSRQNVTSDRPAAGDVPAGVLRDIQSRNELDEALVAFARELFTERVAVEGESLASELRRFTRVNGAYGMLSRAAHATARAFPDSIRTSVRASVDRVIHRRPG
jgi:hypothetical protein